MQLRRHADDRPAILDSIRRIVRLLRESSRAAEVELGVTGAQLFVLQQLAGARSLSVGALAERTLTHQSTVSEVVGRLVRGGWVVKMRGVRDGRSVEVGLTPAGRRLLERAPEAVQGRLIAALGALEPRERRRLRGLLERWVAELDAAAGPAPMFFEEKPSRARRKRPRGR